MIRYHGTPFSGDTTAKLALRGRHAMVSFAEPKDLPTVAELCQSFALDNGAFSAWKNGASLDREAFAAWANEWLKHPGCDFAIVPDVIDGDERENDAILAGWCALGDPRWCPVWHLHESLERLDQLVAHWPRVALGNSGRYSEVSSPAWWQRMAQAMDVATWPDGTPRTRLHGLRMLDSVVFAHVPFSSADSTNVGRNIGLDERWTGPYVPSTQHTRAIILCERIEAHASARRWDRETAGVGWNRDLLG